MVSVSAPLSNSGAGLMGSHAALSRELRRLTRAATFVAIMTSPVAFFWFHRHEGWSVEKSVLVTFAAIVVFRGLVDVLVRRVIPWPSLFGTDDARLREEDVTNRRRAWTWRGVFRRVIWIGGIITVVYLIQLETAKTGSNVTWVGTATAAFSHLNHFRQNPQNLQLAVQIPILFLANFLIFMGPLLLMGVSQIRGYEPGDAEWGVKLDHVRGQAEAKEDIRRVVTLWQSGEVFVASGGKRERGLLFLGAPGTGKTMMAKAIATGFNSPFVSIPGSGFAATFIGVDVIIVRFLARKAKKLARKWGGQCIVFIDEIDAVGMRRQSLGGNAPGNMEPAPPKFYGSWGAGAPGGDMFIETREWREWLFEQRAPERRSPYPGWYTGLASRVNGFVSPQGIFPGMGGMGGGMALNQLLVVMDGIDNPPFMRRFVTSRVNGFLDAIYLVPTRIGKRKLRLPPPKPSGAQIYFIGATNVPLERLDPALIRPGRMGRHVWFRTPTKDDRKDIFDLYLGKVAHDPDLDTPERRDEIARVTSGYSPADIDQICSMALTTAHHEGRAAFTWHDLLDAMTVIETGQAIGIDQPPEELRSTAVHEAGHAVLSHLYERKLESSRLSIRMRAGTLGHHSARQKDESFVLWQSDARARLLAILGAMAAELVFYGENTSGVSGDLRQATSQAAAMADFWGMAPVIPNVQGQKFDDETEDETVRRIQRRFGDIGARLLSSWGGGDDIVNPTKQAFAAQFLGEAFATAYNVIRINKEGVERVANTVLDEKEIYGDALIALLNEQKITIPEIDWTKEESWPQVVLWSKEDKGDKPNSGPGRARAGK
ncbi:MAG TPA: AAA family ATPase [Gaiellaceae bacterium]|nr:AAA family ATPase [Gaiellaceae bacterium]